MLQCTSCSNGDSDILPSTISSSSFLRRVWTFPRKLTTLKDGFFLSSWACRRRDAEPITDPSNRHTRKSRYCTGVYTKYSRESDGQRNKAERERQTNKVSGQAEIDEKEKHGKGEQGERERNMRIRERKGGAEGGGGLSHESARQGFGRLRSAEKLQKKHADLRLHKAERTK